MVIGLSEARVNERHLVYMLTQVREDGGNHLARLAPLGERERRLHQVTDSIFEKAGGVLETGIKFLDGLAVPLG